MRMYKFNPVSFCAYVRDYIELTYLGNGNGRDAAAFALDCGIGESEVQRIINGTLEIDTGVFLDLCFSMDVNPWEFYDHV